MYEFKLKIYEKLLSVGNNIKWKTMYSTTSHPIQKVYKLLQLHQI